MANTYSLEHNITLIYRNAKTGLFEEFLPKTLDSQITCLRDKTAHDHISSHEHVNRFDLTPLRNNGKANGLVVLDEHGFVPLDVLNESLVSVKIEYNTITEMLSQSSSVLPGALVMVINATGDTTVKKGWAIYRRKNSGNYNSLNEGWTKVSENEALDITATWSNYDIPSSAVANIDEAVRVAHSHNNKENVLDNINRDDWGHLRYKDKNVAYMSQVTKFLEGDYLEENEQRLGDLWLKPTVGQIWWNDLHIEYAGVSCKNKYSENVTMVTSPIINTSDAINTSRMFYRCYDLINVQQYDTRKVIDFSGMFQECSSLVTIPFLATYAGENFDDMFYACVKLDHTPEFNLDNGITAANLCYGCVNLTRVLPFGSTAKLTNMRGMFSGCSSLETIYSTLDFTSITSDNDVIDMFADCQELREIRVAAGSIKVSISFSGTNLSKESIESIFEGLAELTNGIHKTIDLTDVDSASYFTSTELKSVTDKGWTILINNG